MQSIPLERIIIDGGTQIRATIDQQAVAEYAEVLDSGCVLPPIVIFDDGAKKWLADGFHRWHAHRKAARLHIDCDVKFGTQRDAIIYATTANTQHGIRLSREDRRKIAETFIKDDEWGKWSDRKIADTTKLSHSFVSTVRKELEAHLSIKTDTRTVERNGKKYEMKVNTTPPSSVQFEADETRPVIEQPDPIFGMKEDFTTIMRELQRIRGNVKALASSPAGKHVKHQHIDRLLKDAGQAIAFAIPYCVTPEGVTEKKWKDIGYITEEQFKQLPADVKKSAVTIEVDTF